MQGGRGVHEKMREFCVCVCVRARVHAHACMSTQGITTNILACGWGPSL